MSDSKIRSGGPVKCPRPCAECPEGLHHFSDAMVDFAEGTVDCPSCDDDAFDCETCGGAGEIDGAEHEAAKAGCLAWHTCKHCDAWREVGDDEDEESSPDSEEEDDYQGRLFV